MTLFLIKESGTFCLIRSCPRIDWPKIRSNITATPQCAKRRCKLMRREKYDPGCQWWTWGGGNSKVCSLNV